MACRQTKKKQVKKDCNGAFSTRQKPQNKKEKNKDTTQLVSDKNKSTNKNEIMRTKLQI